MEMDIKKTLLMLIVLSCVYVCIGEHEEEIPYQNVENICQTCSCQNRQDERQHDHYALNCANKNFQHILARWPKEFGQDHLGTYINAAFSNNYIDILQQLPATNASLAFICRQCGIKNFQAPTFMDVPNIRYLDLSYNNITSSVLMPDVFRGPFHESSYEPIALIELNLSFNKLHALDRKLFEHMPFLSKLSLSHNPFKILDAPTIMALTSVSSLEHLDLSFTGIDNMSSTLFRALYNLRTLNLAGNTFTVMPENLELVGMTLTTLNLAANPFKSFSETSFTGLKNLRRLNISHMPELRQIENNSFTHLEKLEVLHVAHNPQLERFDLDGLMHSKELTVLDISYNALSTLFLQVNFTISDNASFISPHPWLKLRTFLIGHNPWLCDCTLLRVVELIAVNDLHQNENTRCMEPFQLSGTLVFNLTAAKVCALNLPPKFRVIDEQPNRFLRKSYVLRTIFCALFVLVIGIAVGFLVVWIRRRLKREDFGIEPIRYTSVRSSNLSAISHMQQNGNRLSSIINPITNNGHNVA